MHKIFAAVVATIKLNIFELDSLSTLDGFANAEKILSERGGKRYRRFLPITFQFLGSIVVCFRHCTKFRGLPRIPRQSVVFFAITQNQYSAVRRVNELTNCPSVIIDDPFWRSRLLPLTSLVSLLFWPCCWLRLRTVSRQRRNKVKHYLLRYNSYYGIYLVVRIWSLIYRHRMFVLSNDHIGLYRAMHDAVRSVKIPTGYIQHACVASYFPDLIFDYSFLDGLDAANKYNPQAGHGTVFLTGMAKFLTVQTTSEIDRSDDVGVCFNPLDPVPVIKEILTNLLSRFPNRKIVARLHLTIPFELAKSIERDLGSELLEFSNASQESAFEFTGRIWVMVCGASSIILEAAMMGTPSVLFFSENVTDDYQFAENGLCEQARNFDELERALKTQFNRSQEELAEKVEFYCAGFTNPNRAPAAQLIANLIDEIATSGDADYTNWLLHRNFAGNTWEYNESATRI